MGTSGMCQTGFNIATPRQFTRALIDEVIWWHNAMGNPTAYDELMSGSRQRGSRRGRIVRVRRDCIQRVHAKRPEMSMPQLGRLFGRDHTTIIHHLNPEKYNGRKTARRRSDAGIGLSARMRKMRADQAQTSDERAVV